MIEQASFLQVTDKLDGNRAVVELSATSGGVEVLAQARAVVRLS